ncbi:hypothetical protein BH20ACI3_BH20ACI3_23920 [soil metagenome]
MKKLASITLILEFLTAAVFAQSAATPSRLEAEKAIRVAVYESTLAALTAEVKEYKQHAAKRMIELYKAMYEELSKNPETKRRLRESGIQNADDFMANRLRHAASRFASLSRPQIEELARLEAAAPVVFISDTEVEVRRTRVVLEDGEWKVDASEAIKKGLLQHRDETNKADEAIRRALYENALATLNRDVKEYKRVTAKRTLDLYDLVLNELRKDAKARKAFDAAGMTTSDKFLEMVFSRAKSDLPAPYPKESLEKMARRGAENNTITFLSDSQAKIEGQYGLLKAVLEGNEWKIDGTEIMKAFFLRTLLLPSESRAKIERF